MSSTKEKELNNLLNLLNNEFKLNNVINTLNISNGSDHDKIISGVKSLMVKGYVTLEENKINHTFLTNEGQTYTNNGSPEYHLLQYVINNNNLIDVNEALSGVVNGDIGLRKCLKTRTLVMVGKSLKVGPVLQTFDITSEILKLINEFGKNEELMMNKLSTIINDKKELKNELLDLKRRKLINSKAITCYYVRKTDKFKCNIDVQLTDLTSELLDNDQWKSYTMKKYNFFSSGKRISAGTIHPINHTINEFRQIFTAMGFEVSLYRRLLYCNM